MLLNSFGKFFRAVCLLLLSVLFLNSCVSNNDEKLPFVTLDETNNAIVSEYRIVVSRTASGEVLEAARELCSSIGEQTDVDTRLSYDDETVYVSDSTWVVYVGYVDTSAVRDILRNMRSEDYICRSYDRETIIGGRSDGATLNAILRFKNEILPVSDRFRLIPEGGGFEYKGEYSLNTLYIGDASVQDFEIVVYSAQDTEVIDTAYSLRQRISDTTGYWLDVCIGSRSKTGRGIYVIKDSECQLGRAELSNSKNDVILRAKDRKGLEKIADTFMNLLTSDSDKVIQKPNIPSALYVPYGEISCDLALSLLSYLPIFGSMELNADFKNTVAEYSPDILLGGAVTDEKRSIISNLLDNYDVLSADGGMALGGENINIERIKTEQYREVLCDTFYVKHGALEFMLVYLSGKATENISIELENIVGNTPLPIIAVSYTEGGEQVSVTHAGQPYFDTVISSDCSFYKRGFSFVCHTDVSRLSVTDGGDCDTYGIKLITIAVK